MGDQTTSRSNGRVDLLSPMPSLTIGQPRQVQNNTFANEATVGQVARTELSCMFFSANNIDALQHGIRYRVFVETDGAHVIGRQSDQELKIVMRSIYYQHARNLPDNIIGQVRELNSKVLEWSVPRVLSNLMQHQTFIRDASTLPMPLDHAPLMTTKGTRSLEAKPFV